VVKLLRRFLYWEAALWGLFGVLLALVPSWFLQTVMDQLPIPEHAWVRILGVHVVGIALLMVVVGHRVETIWWFSWAFVLVFAGTAGIAVLNAMFSLRAGSSAAAWWVLAGVAVAFAACLLVGLARTGLERPAE
jgi:hypothetical protein